MESSVKIEFPHISTYIAGLNTMFNNVVHFWTLMFLRVTNGDDLSLEILTKHQLPLNTKLDTLPIYYLIYIYILAS